MKKKKQTVEKITKYSIRKLSVGVGPVAIGAFLLGASLLTPQPVQADQYTQAANVHLGYVTEDELTSDEEAQVIHAIPDQYQNEDTFYLVYRKKGMSQQTLPQTGSQEVALLGLSFATASLAVLLLSKKHRNKVMGVLLIGAMGQSLLLPVEVAALQNQVLLPYNQTISVSSSKDLAAGVIQIDGYDYVGYLRYPTTQESDKEVSTKIQKKQESASPTTQTSPVAPPLDLNSRVTPEDAPAFPTLEKPRVEVSTEPIPFETVEQADATLAKGQSKVLTAGQTGERRIVTEVSLVDGKEVRRVIENTVIKEPVSQVLSVGTKEETQPSPQPVVTAKGTQEVGHEGEALVQPETPSYTGVVDAKGTQEVGHEGEAAVQPENPSYTGVVDAKGTQEVGHEGEAVVQPENPSYQMTEGTVAETETVSLPYATESVADANRYTDEESVIQKGQVGSQLIRRVYKTINGEKVGEPISTSTETLQAPVNEKISRGTKAIEGQTEEVSIEEIPFKTATEQDASLQKGTEIVSQVGKNGKKKITKVYKTIKGVKTADAPTVSEEVVEAPQDRIIKKGTKELEKPSLTLATLDKEELNRTAKATYR